MPTVTTFLWFNDRAEDAARFYTSVFPNSSIEAVMPGPNGGAMGVTFRLEGQSFTAFNGGPHHQLSPAVSLFVSCETQQEVDALWDKLLEGGGQPSRCGWLQDRFGLSWQVIPKALGRMLGDPDREKAGRAMQAMLGMSKIDVGAMERAFNDQAVA